jgi:predicted kinase
VRIIVATPVLK